MKTYAIRDKDIEKEMVIGYLMYYEKANECVIELNDELDEWEAPLLFQKYVREKVFTIPKDVAMMWICERVIPSGRQNIGLILKNAKMQEYNELELLVLSKGKCSQDNCYIEEIAYKDVPEKITKRVERNVAECFPADSGNVICLFRDNLVRKVSLEKLVPRCADVSYVLKSMELFYSVKVGVGGYSICFNDSIEISVEMLRDETYEVPVVATDFMNYIKNNVVDTTKACELMDCSRQNISYLVNTGKMEPVKNSTKEKLFTLGCIEKMITE